MNRPFRPSCSLAGSITTTLFHTQYILSTHSLSSFPFFSSTDHPSRSVQQPRHSLFRTKIPYRSRFSFVVGSLKVLEVVGGERGVYISLNRNKKIPEAKGKGKGKRQSQRERENRAKDSKQGTTAGLRCTHNLHLGGRTLPAEQDKKRRPLSIVGPTSGEAIGIVCRGR